MRDDRHAEGSVGAASLAGAVGCDEVHQAVPMLLDNELDAEYELQLEAHLSGCADCRSELEREGRLRLTLRRAASSVSAPAALRRRLHQALEDDARRRRWPARVWPATAAAAVLLAFVWRGATGAPETSEPLEAAASLWHRDDVPMDVVSAEVTPVQNYLRQRLPFAVELPRSQAVQPVSLGGRVIRFGDRDAAFVRYQLPRGRASFVVYEDDRAPVTEGNQSYKLGNTYVQLQRLRGYTTARWYSRGLSYTVVTDLPDQELVGLLDASARR